MREARAGDKPIEAAYLGNTPIKRMYAGGTLAWPPPPLGVDYSFSDGVLLFAEEDDSCPECDGTGEVNCPECGGSGTETCPECGGTGEVEGEPCPTCEGTGEADCPTCGGAGLVSCPTCDGDGLGHTTEYEDRQISYDAATGTLYIDEGGDGE